MPLKDIIKNHKNLLIIVTSFAIITLAWAFLSTFSEPLEDSSWDGVIAESFQSGTGSLDNPYVISNAGEYAYFKKLLESEDATVYASRNFVITKGFNYGNFDMSINNTVPFSGTLDGNYNVIYNLNLTKSLFNTLSNATIKDLNILNINYTSNESSGILAGTMEQTSINNIALYGSISIEGEVPTDYIASGIANSDEGSTIENAIVNIDASNINYVSLVANTDHTTFTNVFVLDRYDKLQANDNSDISSVYELSYENDTLIVDSEVISSINNEECSILNIDNQLLFTKTVETPKGGAKAPSRSASISVHATEIDTANHAIYINDLTKDTNYYQGLNYTEINNTIGTIPDGTNQNLYTNSNLATLYIRYSSADINDSSTYGSVSVSEDIRDYYYFKKYPVVNGYVTFDLIDNPWANRPTGRAFNGWVTDYTGAVVSLDMDVYVRSVKIPVSDISEPISITFYSCWTISTEVYTTGNLSNLKSVTMQSLTSGYEDLTQFYITGTVNYNNRFPNNNNLYDLDGNHITARSYCNTRPSCTYLYPNTSSSYQNITYYRVTPNGNNPATVEAVTPRYFIIQHYEDGGIGAGYFVRATSGTENVYSQSGEKLTSCGNSCYKLLQYSDGALDRNTTYYYLPTRDTNIFAPSASSTNTSNISTSRPMTVTGINNGVDNSANRSIYLNGSWSMSADVRVEFITFYQNSTTTNVSEFDDSSYKIQGNYNNLKLGRGLRRDGSNITASSFVGASSSSNSSLSRYTLIVESGYYQNGSGVGYGVTQYNGSVSVPTQYVNAYVTLGSDYDRVAQTNNTLIVYYCYAGTWGSNLYSRGSTGDTYDIPAIHTIVKSGSYGSNQEDYAAGIYVGGRASGSHYAMRSILVEGGSIFNLIGGPMASSNRASKNDIIMNVTGGTMNMVFGGAGVSNTVGNRILNITGGTINYSILGGSNAFELNNSNNPYGKIDGDILLYVGGSTIVGTQSGSLYNIAAGNVFGAGNGRSGELDVGSVNNSNVIIGPTATIHGDVYGGGNFGAVGGSLTGSSSSTPVITSGVYEDETTDNNIRYYGPSPDNYIMFNGERYRIIGLFNNVNTSGGAKDLVRIVKTSSLGNRAWGDTNMTTVETNTSTETSGNWTTNTYNYTNYYKNYYNFYVKGDNSTSNIYNYLNTTYYNNLNSTSRAYIEEVTWDLGAAANASQNASSFYTAERSNTVVNYLTGISQTSNGSSASSASFKIGLFYPSDYGFANNDNTCLNTNLGSYSNSCKTNNWMGSLTNAWTITQSTDVNSVTRTYQVGRTGSWMNGYTYTMNRYYHVVNRNFIVGSTALELRDIYYTNNNNDNDNYYNTNAVYPSFYLKDDVTISGGDGSYEDPYIIGSSDDLLTDIIYEIMHPSTSEPGSQIVLHDESDYQARTHIEILGGNISGSVYGAGNSNGAGNSTNGNVALAKITIDVKGGQISNSVYGGSNTKGRVYGDVFVNVINGDIDGSVYGGGQGGYTDDTDHGTYVSDNVFVKIGDTNTTNLDIAGNVYGGSAFGSVNTVDETTTTSSYGTSVTVNAGTIHGSVFGGGQGNTTFTPKVVGPIKVTINGGDMSAVFGGNDQAGTHDKTNEVYLYGGIIENVYGGGNRSSVTNTNVYLDGATVTNLHGGSNSSGAVSTTNVDIKSGTVHNVFGGNRSGGTCGSTDVDVTGTATITGGVYGGGDAVSTTSTKVTIHSAGSTIPEVYGGGRSANVTTALINKEGCTVTALYGGSNSSGTVTSSTINHSGGTTTTLYGGNNAGGNTVASTINHTAGTITTLYGGGKQATGGTSTINVGGTNPVVGTLYGGGYSAGLTSSTITVTSGTINDLYGGSNTSGDVTNTNITITNVTSIDNIYGGGKQAKVTTPVITVTAGTIGNIYGGGDLAEVSGNTTVDINGGTIDNVYGGGNLGVVKGNSNVTITDATINYNVYGGGKGATATLEQNTSVTIDGNTVIGSSTSVAPNAGCVFGGGEGADTGKEVNNNSTATVKIAGGTIYGNVYGGAKFAVIYGSTDVKIGKSAQANGLTPTNIYVKGHVFGGGEANSSGSSDIYDWSFISVNEGTSIDIDADTYNSFDIDGSFFGGGNASSASGDSYLLIKNYGTQGSPKENISIQRFTYVTIDNSSILLKGAIDRANDYDRELFAVSRVDDLKIKNNTEIYFETGANLLKKFESLDSSGNPASVTIDTEHNTLTRTVDNRVYMYEGRNLNIAKDQQVTDYGEVIGMSFFGIFNYDNDHNVNTGIYEASIDPGDTLDWSGTFTRGSYVLGKHVTNHNIQVDGFYSNFMNEDTEINEVNYITPTPATGHYYMWFIGENVIEYNVNLVASKYSTLGSQEASFLEFYKPNTSFQILSFDSSEIAQGISLVDKNSIPRIASNAADANSNFGLSMEASNSGWLTTGKTSFYTREPSISGVTYYEGENTSTVPTMLFYLYHSKNITEAKDLGTVRISVMAITKLNALSNEIKRLVINVNMSTELFQTVKYEGAMTPGDKYELFVSTANNITTKSKFSVYYGLYDDSNLYRTGYHRVLSSSYVLPVGTKITMLDFNQGTPEYYYHVINATDYAAAQSEFNQKGECSYNLSLFTRMGSKSNNDNYDDATKNAQYYDGTSSSEEFIFIVDFEDTNISSNQLNNTLLIEIRDANEDSIIGVLGIQQSQLTYSLYYGYDSEISPTITPSTNPLYLGYSDTFTTTINYRNSALNGVDIIDTQYFDDKLGATIYIKNSQNNIVSGTDLTGTYFTVDGVRYYPDISGYTHIKLSDKIGNIQKWIIFNTENSTLSTGDYTFVIETFASPDGIYYSSGNPVIRNIPITIISTTYGLNPVISDASTIFSTENDEDMIFTVNYTSLLNNPSIRIAMYRRKYDTVYDTNYELVDFQDFIDLELVSTGTNEYMLIANPNATNNFTLPMNTELESGTYRLAFRLYDNDTKIGEIIRYIIVK